jgi:hypothetical protein
VHGCDGFGIHGLIVTNLAIKIRNETEIRTKQGFWVRAP